MAVGDRLVNQYTVWCYKNATDCANGGGAILNFYQVVCYRHYLIIGVILQTGQGLFQRCSDGLSTPFSVCFVQRSKSSRKVARVVIIWGRGRGDSVFSNCLATSALGLILRQIALGLVFIYSIFKK